MHHVNLDKKTFIHVLVNEPSHLGVTHLRNVFIGQYAMLRGKTDFVPHRIGHLEIQYFRVQEIIGVCKRF